MKNLLLFTNLVTLCLLGFLWFGSCHDDGTDCPTCGNTCYSPRDEGNLQGVTLDYAKMLVDNYRQKQWTTYKERGIPAAFVDARSAWFNLDTLKRFIREIETRTCESCGGDSLLLGVRIYYGTYPEQAEWGTNDMRGVDTDYAGHHTLLMVPTYWNSRQNADVDFDPRHFISACKPLNIDSIRQGNVIFMVPLSERRNFQNHGGNWPPPYDGRFEDGFNIEHLDERGTKLATITDQPFIH